MIDQQSGNKFSKIDKITSQWEQGDCYIGKREFFFQINPNHRIASDSEQGEEGDDIFVVDVDGLCVISQTCDIVRNCKDRPYLEVSPLVKVGNDNLKEIKKGRRPSRAYLPNLEHQKLVVDLDRVMTVEKSCLKDVELIKGCNLDSERRSFARALSRKRIRFAFPDDFVRLVSKLKNKMANKHDKDSGEGEALRSLKEIRIAASPSWSSDDVDLNFYFIHDSGQSKFQGKSWDDYRNSWVDLLKTEGRFKTIVAEVRTLESLSAKEYVDSDQMDFDHLSGT